MRFLAALLLWFTVGLTSATLAKDLKSMVVAGGCFWCVESDFDSVPGVVETVSGYTGGDVDNPTYKQVSAQNTGHYEAVRITYDADVVTYRQLLDRFWRTVDPTDAGGQFCDRGPSYRTAVFAGNQQEADIAKATRSAAASELKQPIVTQIFAASTFWPAEEYHQNYHIEHPIKYRFYRTRCGRDNRLRELWGDSAGGGV